MNGTNGVLIVSEDMVIRGVREIRNCKELVVHGYVEGDVSAGKVVIQPSGKCYGTMRSESIEVHGDLQGNVTVKHLINIKSSGSVSGNVQYGKLALEPGGNLSAEVRNVPPTLGGDLDLTVEKGRSVAITLQDITALDPDDKPKDLVFTVSNARNGFIILSGAPAKPINRFTQSDLEGGRVLFRHDGTSSAAAGFSVVVADSSGATSGAAQQVNVAVRG